MAYRGYKARRSLARRGGPGRAEILRAVPRGSRRLRGRRIEKNLLDALAADPRALALRADARENLLLFARYLARTADYETAVTRPTRTALCGYARRSASTWKACRRRLEAWGYLGLVTPGRCYWLGEETRNDAATYVIAVPRAASRSAVTRPPTCPTKSACDGPRARGPEKPLSGAAASGRAHSRRRRRDAHGDVAAGAGAAHAAVLRIGPGQTISDGWAGWLLAPFLAAGWTPADLQFAINHRPDGRPHRHPVRDVANPAPWLRWRLAHWLTDPAATWRHATPVPSRSQRSAAVLARLRADQAERAAGRRAAAAAASTTPATHAAAIRAAMGWPAPRTPRPEGPTP